MKSDGQVYSDKYVIDVDYSEDVPYKVFSIPEYRIYDTKEEAQKICDKLNEEAQKCR